MRVSKANVRHYYWGEGCDGWALLTLPDLRVIQERVPPGAAETWHSHARARQFFYVLDGSLVLETRAGRALLGAGEGCEVPPGTVHRVCNEAVEDVEFLVISSPTTHGDRIDEQGSNAG